jgi:hypothetical protein
LYQPIVQHGTTARFFFFFFFFAKIATVTKVLIFTAARAKNRCVEQNR